MPTSRAPHQIATQCITNIAGQMSDLYLDWQAATRQDDMLELEAAMRKLFSDMARKAVDVAFEEA